MEWRKELLWEFVFANFERKAGGLPKKVIIPQGLSRLVYKSNGLLLKFCLSNAASHELLEWVPIVDDQSQHSVKLF